MFETNRQTLILARGIPGSGKSTLAALLGFMAGTPIIEEYEKEFGVYAI